MFKNLGIPYLSRISLYQHEQYMKTEQLYLNSTPGLILIQVIAIGLCGQLERDSDYLLSQPEFACSKLKIETLEQGNRNMASF